MDFAFVPPPANKKDWAIINAREVLAKRVGSLGLIPTSANSLKEMLTFVDTNAGGSIGSVFLVSHASPTHVTFPLTPAQSLPSVYQVLADLYKPPYSFGAPSSFRLTPAPGATPIPIIIKGCRVGRSEAFMRLLKSIIGPGVTVEAPQHFNYFMHIGDRATRYIFDCLGYDFEIHRKERITKHLDLRTAFSGGAFERYDGSAMPSAELTALIDQLKTEVRSTYLPSASTAKEIKIGLKTKVIFNETVIGSKVHAMNRDKGMAQYRAMRVSKTIARMNLDDFGAKPLVDHIAKAEADWNAKYQSANVLGGTVKNSFAEYLGLHKGEDPAALVNWQVDDDRDGEVKGKRIEAIFYRYELIVPITSVSDGTLLFESEAIQGTALTTPVTWPSNSAHISALFRRV